MKIIENVRAYFGTKSIRLYLKNKQRVVEVCNLEEAQSIGRSLVEKCIAALQSIGIQKCHLFIFSSNENGIRFWEKIGWTPRKDIGVVPKEIQ